jgi:hypothetical protein
MLGVKTVLFPIDDASDAESVYVSRKLLIRQMQKQIAKVSYIKITKKSKKVSDYLMTLPNLLKECFA